jgi:hypothetical protein
MLDLRREVPQTGKMLTIALTAAGVLLAAWLLSNVITANGKKGIILLLAVIAVVAVAAKTLTDWRNGLYLFFAWLLFEDFVRKYMGNNMYVYFGKDALIGIVYMSLVMARMRGEHTERFRPPFKYALGIFVLLGLAQAFNPGSPSMWYGVLGLKLYFYYVPLMFVGYALLRSERDLQRFLILNAGLAAVISMVAILQSIIGINFLNPRSGADIDQLAHEVRMTASGMVVSRVPSVFVSEGRCFDYLALALTLALGTAGYVLLRTTRGRKIVFPAAALVAVAIIVSGSRTGLVYLVGSSIFLSAAMLWGAPRKLGEGYRLVKAIRRSFVSVGLAVGLATVLFPTVVGARWSFYWDTISPNSPDSETANRTWDYPVSQLQRALSDRGWLTGHGIGVASLGGQYVSRIMEVPTVEVAVESGYGALILELGVLGLVLWLAWTSSLMLFAFKVLIKLKGTWAFPMAVSIFWFAFYILFPRTYLGIQAYQDFILNAYLWLLVGILFRLPALVAQTASSESAVNSRELAVSR